MLDQTLQQMLPNLTAAAKAELNLRLAELWDYKPVVVRYRKGKRLVLGFYWLKSGDLRCISIRPNEIRIERYDSEKDKLYYRRGVNLSNDKLSKLQNARWASYERVNVTEWLARTLAPVCPAVVRWRMLILESNTLSPIIRYYYQTHNQQFQVIDVWWDSDLKCRLALRLDQNRISIWFITETLDAEVNISLLSYEGAAKLLSRRFK